MNRSAAEGARALRIAMILHGSYPWDERVKREAQALVDAGHEVDVVCLKRDADEPAHEKIHGVCVYRLPLRRVFTDARSSYLREYALAFAGCIWRLTALHARRRYDVVQVHTLPDVLVFVSVFARLTGAMIVLDMHDLMPELYMSKFGLSEESRSVRVLRLMERASTRYAHHVITASEGFRDRLVEAGVPSDKVTLVLNTADPAVFPNTECSEPPRGGTRFTVFWHGKIVYRYGLDLAIKAVAALRESIPGLSLVIYGEGEQADALGQLVRSLSLNAVVEFRGHVSHLEVADHIRAADVGIVPNRPDSHIEMAYPTKLFEFVQMGIPVVATRTKVLSDLFGDDSIVFVDANARSIAEGIDWVYQHPFEARKAATRARVRCEPVSWPNMRNIYVGAIEKLATAHSMAH